MYNIRSMAKQEDLRKSTSRFYNEVNIGYDRNLKLAGDSGLLDHHFGLGYFDTSKIPGMSQQEISDAIRSLETIQARVLIDMMGDVTPQHQVLDAGCGRGGTAFRLHDLKHCEIDGVTIAGKQAQFASAEAQQRGCQYGVRFWEMDMLALGFPQSSFDRIFSNETTP